MASFSSQTKEKKNQNIENGGGGGPPNIEKKKKCKERREVTFSSLVSTFGMKCSSNIFLSTFLQH
jgi:hypothetical protein